MPGILDFLPGIGVTIDVQERNNRLANQQLQNAQIRKSLSLADLAEQRAQQDFEAQQQQRQLEMEQGKLQLASKAAAAIQALPEQEREIALASAKQELNKALPGAGDILNQKSLPILRELGVSESERREDARKARTAAIQEGQLELGNRRFEESVRQFNQKQDLSEAQFLQRVEEFMATNKLAERSLRLKEITQEEATELRRAEILLKAKNRQSAIGKAFQDAADLEAEGKLEEADLIRTSIFQEMLQGADKKAKDLSKETFNNEAKLRGEFTKVAKDFISVNDAHNRVLAAADDPSAAGDLALIFNYMKVLDPGSTVREGEFATAQNAGSIPDIIRAQYNKVARGERLSKTQRSDFVDRSGRLHSAQLATHRRNEENFTALSNRNQLNPENVVIDFVGDRKAAEADPVAEALKLLGL